jgi:hypothetical protein
VTGSPCVAAHSTTRALFDAYSGPLYAVNRTSDGARRDISAACARGADAARAVDVVVVRNALTAADARRAGLAPDALVQLSVLYRTTSTAPAVGARYILPAGATGAPWTGQPAGTLMAFQDGAWEAVTPVEGWCTFVADEAAQVVWTGAA